MNLENGSRPDKFQEPEQAVVTSLLRSFPQRQDELYEMVYLQLKAIARNRLVGESPGKALQPTALVNEAYMKLVQQKTTWRDRRHFYGVAAEAMRRILIDAARSRNRSKRGGDVNHQPLSNVVLPTSEWDPDLLDLNDALIELEKQSPDKAEIVRLKFFSGLTFEECAELMNVSVSTVERRWRFARAWLRSRIKSEN